MIANKVKIAIVDDHSIVIDGMVLLLSFEKKIEIQSTYTNGFQLIKKLRENSNHPDILLLDLLMPEISGVECSEIIKKEFPHIKIIVLTMECDTKVIHQLIHHIGVEGFLNKSLSRKDLLDCVDLVSRGYYYITKEVETCLENYREKIIQNDHIKLSNREKEIVKHLMQGYTNMEIAEKLFISESTVETHRKNIYRKTDTHNIPKLINLVNDLDLLK